MFIFIEIIILCWIVFYTYWLFAAIGVKKTIKGSTFLSSISLRLGIVLIFLFLAHTPIFTHLFQNQFKNYAQHLRSYLFVSSDYILGWIGVGITVMGIAFAIWARVNLGKNWGMPMAIKQKPSLVTSGPYAYVRHPIYSGILLGLLGSALVFVIFWIFFVGSVLYFIYSLGKEEKHMLKQFPTEYENYKKRTKKLVPFIY